MSGGPSAVAASRRRLWTETAGIAVSSGGFGLVYGLAARNAGFSPVEAMAMSLIVFAGASQFAAIGLVTGGLAWPGIMLLTALLNARHLLYSAALAPWLRAVPRLRRAAMAFVLTDESFALSMAHFVRLGAADERGYWYAAIASTFVPWNLMTFAGVMLGAQIADPSRLGLDVVFPAAMAGLAVGLLAGRREVVAATVGAGTAVAASLFTGTAVGVVAGGLVGPLVGLALPGRTNEERARPVARDRWAGTDPGDAASGLP